MWVTTALWEGLRGLPAGSSLARLLNARRMAGNRRGFPRLVAVRVYSAEQLKTGPDDERVMSAQSST